MDVPEINIEQAAIQISSGAAVLDVREPDEYRDGHVPGAPLIPLGDLPERSDEISTTGPLLVICRSGARSRKASEHLRSLGIDAINIAGGTMAWIEAGHRVVVGDEPGA